MGRFVVRQRSILQEEWISSVHPLARYDTWFVVERCRVANTGKTDGKESPAITVVQWEFHWTSACLELSLGAEPGSCAHIQW